ncbi:MAG: flagellar biosynthetic protein FliR [Oscillospiraceae bacterium]
MAELNILIDNLHVYIFVFVRLAAIILFNPVFSRQNIIAPVKVGLIMCLTVIITPLVPVTEFDSGFIGFVFCIAKEFFIGFLLGFVFNIYYYMLMFAADIMDTQFGFSMAKVMDPQTRIQSAVIGNLMNVMFMLYFFVTNSHLVLIDTAVHSFDVIGAGAQSISIKGGCSFAIGLMSSICLLALRLALPFVAAEFVLEVSMGILMKLIPQIHVFVIQMQGKLLLGIIMLMALAVPITNFVDNYIAEMFGDVNKALEALVIT